MLPDGFKILPYTKNSEAIGFFLKLSWKVYKLLQVFCQFFHVRISLSIYRTLSIIEYKITLLTEVILNDIRI